MIETLILDIILLLAITYRLCQRITNYLFYMFSIIRTTISPMIFNVDFISTIIALIKAKNCLKTTVL